MRRILLLFLLTLFLTPCLQAQKKTTIKKRFKEARAAIKAGSGQENIEKILLDSIALPTTPDHTKAEGYLMCAQLKQSINDALNMKAYLKQTLDTAKLYRTVLDIYGYTLKSDSLDAKGKYRNKNINLRALHRDNLLGGGKYHMRSMRWAEAFPYFDMFLSTCTTDMNDVIGRVAYLATICAVNEHNAHHVLRHVDTAIEHMPEKERPILSECKARSCVSLGDSAQWVDILKEGVDRYPGYNYFFLNLMEYYMHHDEVERGMAITDSLVNHDGDRAIYWFAMSMFALHNKEYDMCIELSEECLKREPDNVDALYNKGISLLNLALNEKLQSRRTVLYRQALKPMERVRQLSPEDIGRWGMPLYRIYLHLNMGSKFEEIDSLLSDLPAGKMKDKPGSVRDSIPESDAGASRMDKRLSK